MLHDCVMLQHTIVQYTLCNNTDITINHTNRHTTTTTTTATTTNNDNNYNYNYNYNNNFQREAAVMGLEHQAVNLTAQPDEEAYTI